MAKDTGWDCNEVHILYQSVRALRYLTYYLGVKVVFARIAVSQSPRDCVGAASLASFIIPSCAPFSLLMIRRPCPPKTRCSLDFVDGLGCGCGYGYGSFSQ